VKTDKQKHGNYGANWAKDHPAEAKQQKLSPLMLACAVCGGDKKSRVKPGDPCTTCNEHGRVTDKHFEKRARCHVEHTKALDTQITD
jgi:hypothetical protein